jgi:hypothetical protein
VERHPVAAAVGVGAGAGTAFEDAGGAAGALGEAGDAVAPMAGTWPLGRSSFR